MKEHVANFNELPADYIDGSADSPMVTLYLSRAVSSRNLYANIDRLRPGAKSCKYHSHTKQEEFFLILKGNCLLRLNDTTRRLRVGDFVSKPAGDGLAHQFINDSSDDVEILDVGIITADDRIHYPDEEVEYNPSTKQASKFGVPISSWTTDPN